MTSFPSTIITPISEKMKLKIQTKLISIDPIVVSIIPDKKNILGKVGIVKHKVILTSKDTEKGMIVLFKTLVKEPYLENLIITKYNCETSKKLKKFIIAEDYMTVQEFLSYLFDEKIETIEDITKVAMKIGFKVEIIKEKICKYDDTLLKSESTSLLIRIENLSIIVIGDHNGKPVDVVIYKTSDEMDEEFTNELNNIILNYDTEKVIYPITLDETEFKVLKAILEENYSLLAKCLYEEKIVNKLKIFANYGYTVVDVGVKMPDMTQSIGKYLINVEELDKKYKSIKDKIEKAKEEYREKVLKKKIKEILTRMINNYDKLIIAFKQPDQYSSYWITISHEENILTLCIPYIKELKNFKIDEFKSPEIELEVVDKELFVKEFYLGSIVSEFFKEEINQLYNKIFDIILLLEELLYEEPEKPEFINHKKLGKIAVLFDTVPETKKVEDVIKMLKDNNIDMCSVDAVVITSGYQLEYGRCAKYFPLKSINKH